MDIIPAELLPAGVSAVAVTYCAALVWALVECLKRIKWISSDYYRILACGLGVALLLLAYLFAGGQQWAGVVLAGLGVGALTTGAEKKRQDRREKAAQGTQEGPGADLPPQAYLITPVGKSPAPAAQEPSG